MTLYRLVEAYAGLGDHRTGTDIDGATIAWFADELRSAGGDVTIQPFRFDRYDATWDMTIAGRPVDALPLFYEGIGRVRHDRPTTGAAPAFDLLIGRPVHAELVETARRDGSGVVVCATTGMDGDRLVVPNRRPQTPHDVPVVLVEGRAAPDLAAVVVEIDARVVEGTSANVIARLGSGSGAPLVVATPLSGWFACAGERGPGIAIALELARALAARTNVVVIGTSGHELVDLGLRRLLTDKHPDARAILHLGACVAATDAARICTTSVPDDAFAVLERALGPLELTPNRIPADQARDPARWVGESREWCRLGVPLVSIAGHHPFFHTPQDTAEAGTSEALLERAFEALLRVAGSL